MSIEITEKDILEAQSDVLPVESVFNLQQKEFISCLESCSVQAYAGTGKTSTLVGKLHALAQKQVWQNEGGICVLSHTNVAVNEVKKKVAQNFPGIMDYPNFVGTIQEFVNTFLFSPYLAHGGKRIRSQDSSRRIDLGISQDDGFKDRYIKKRRSLRAAPGDFGIKKFYNELSTMHESGGLIMCRNIENELVEFTALETIAFPKVRLFQPLKDIIDERCNAGRFLFDESFVGAKKYLEEKPIVIDAIRERFRYVFLDEAQDCSSLQLEILHKLFTDTESVVFQQIGDENQEISDDVWVPGDNPMMLTESVRFGASISGFINKFKLNGESNVVGVADSDTEMVLITYTNERKNDVLEEYARLIQARNMLSVEGEGFYAIASEHKVLEEFHSNYSRALAKRGKSNHRASLDNDSDYLSLLKKDLLIKYGENHIFNTLFGLLYKHYREDGEWYELRRLIRDGEHSEQFKLLVREVATDVSENGFVTDVSSINDTLNRILGEEKLSIQIQTTIQEDFSSEQNILKFDNGIEIKLGTIHGVKGQTHNATLFLSDVKRNRSDFGWVGHNAEVKSKSKYKKLIYVAASRPRQLFVVAISIEEYKKVVGMDFFNGFQIVELG